MQECQLYGENMANHDIKYRRKNKSSCHCLWFLLLLHVDVRIHMLVLWNLSQCKIPLQFKKKGRKKILSLPLILEFLFLFIQSTRGHKLQLLRSVFKYHWSIDSKWNMPIHLSDF